MSSLQEWCREALVVFKEHNLRPSAFHLLSVALFDLDSVPVQANLAASKHLPAPAPLTKVQSAAVSQAPAGAFGVEEIRQCTLFWREWWTKAYSRVLACKWFDEIWAVLDQVATMTGASQGAAYSDRQRANMAEAFRRIVVRDARSRFEEHLPGCRHRKNRK